MGDNNKQDEVRSLALHIIPAGNAGKTLGHTPDHGTPKSDSRSASTSVDGGEIDVIPHHPLALPTRSPVHFVLGNFLFATFLITLIIFIAFFTLTWFTVLQSARSMNDWVLSNAVGVSLCLHDNEKTSLMITAEIGVDTRSWSSTGSRHRRIIHLMEGCRLRYELHFR